MPGYSAIGQGAWWNRHFRRTPTWVWSPRASWRSAMIRRCLSTSGWGHGGAWGLGISRWRNGGEKCWFSWFFSWFHEWITKKMKEIWHVSEVQLILPRSMGSTVSILWILWFVVDLTVEWCWCVKTNKHDVLMGYLYGNPMGNVTNYRTTSTDHGISEKWWISGL